MELEFDKEIDALLRKARSGTAAAVKGSHLDADAIAAFAEGAIPDAIRKTYTAHLGDCDSCRKALSHVALLNEPVALKAVAAAAGAAPMMAAPARQSAAPWPPKAAPWYRPLFKSPGLAAAFGILVLVFGLGLVYLVTQRNSNTAATVALDENKPAANSITYAGIDSDSAANANSTAMSNASSTAANAAVSNAARSAANSTANAATRSGATTVDGIDSPAAAAPPPSGSASGAVSQPTTTAPRTENLPINGRRLSEAPLDKPKTANEERKQDKDEQKETTRSRSLEDDRLARGDVAAKKVPAGPMRGAGPVQNQIQSNVVGGEMPVTSKVGGKTFHNSNGAWYDNAYHGQSTTNIRRSSDDFKKLDSGLRSIANDLGGVVVVVWKDKAYRIQ